MTDRCKVCGWPEYQHPLDTDHNYAPDVSEPTLNTVRELVRTGTDTVRDVVIGASRQGVSEEDARQAIRDLTESGELDFDVNARLVVRPHAPSVSTGQPSEAAPDVCRGQRFGGAPCGGCERCMEEQAAKPTEPELPCCYECHKCGGTGRVWYESTSHEDITTGGLISCDCQRVPVRPHAPSVSTGQPSEAAMEMARPLAYLPDVEDIAAALQKLMDERDRQVQGVKHFQTLLDLARQRAEAVEKELEAETAVLEECLYKERKRAEAAEKARDETNARANAVGTWVAQEVAAWKARAEAAEKQRDFEANHRHLWVQRAEAAEKARDRWVKMAYDMEAGWNRAERYAKLWKALAKRDHYLADEAADASYWRERAETAEKRCRGIAGNAVVCLYKSERRTKRWKALAKRFYKDLLWRGREYQLKERG